LHRAETPALSAAGVRGTLASFEHASRSWPAARIGPDKVVAEIGLGGMGAA
jgi:hypothetical protein